MAQKVEVLLIDDFDGGSADETVRFALDGRDYEIDLSSENAARLRSDVAAWKDHARKTSGGRARRPSRTDLGPSPRALREWAKSNGYQLADRGRVPEPIRQAYLEKHPTKA